MRNRAALAALADCGCGEMCSRPRGLGAAVQMTRANCHGTFQSNSPMTPRLPNEDWGTCYVPDAPQGGGGLFPQQQTTAQKSSQSVSVAPVTQVTVSPQISPVFQQSSGSGGQSAGTTQTSSAPQSASPQSTVDSAAAKAQLDAQQRALDAYLAAQDARAKQQAELVDRILQQQQSAAAAGQAPAGPPVVIQAPPPPAQEQAAGTPAPVAAPASNLPWILAGVAGVGLLVIVAGRNRKRTSRS